MTEELVDLKIGQQVGNWIVEKRLGGGSFGAIYLCKDSKKGGQYALKVEEAHVIIQLLKMELVVLNELKNSNTRHFCTVEDKGREQNFIYIVMTLVGRSLEDLRISSPQRKFSLGTAISVSIQCLEALQELHSIGYLHRDVKPGNYTTGRAEMNELRKIYLLDFGMCRKYIQPDGTIKMPRTQAAFRGTVKYAPLACHLRKDLCRLDDCESWFYMMIEITKGSLPWRSLNNLDEVGNCKKYCRSRQTEARQLFSGCPRDYIQVMRMIDRGYYFDEPKYEEMYSILRKVLKIACVSVSTKRKRSIQLIVWEYPYDWELKE
ncbi:unnamed protein product [Thelazia callipaeda]|uniref:non-specific serine/threonine protein kinase n=1 Tax=Thelazia callipaeda TaxID=103827 RepID=A0A0N5CVD6_THECL|nr:unnamed protein product [Thelazia callipaeda]